MMETRKHPVYMEELPNAVLTISLFKKYQIYYLSQFCEVCELISFRHATSLHIKMLYFFFCTLALSAAATVANIKIGYDGKTPQFVIFVCSTVCPKVLQILTII